MWRICSSTGPSACGALHRIAAALAVFQNEFEVLTGEILQTFVGGQLQLDDDDVVGLALDRVHAARQFLDLHVADTGHFADVHFEIGAGGGATQQRQAARLLVVRQRGRRMRALLDLAANDRALARAACAVLAAVRQADALAKGGCQHGFVGFHLKLPAALPERYVECHKSFSLRIQKIGNQCVWWIAATMRPR